MKSNGSLRCLWIGWRVSKLLEVCGLDEKTTKSYEVCRMKSIGIIRVLWIEGKVSEKYEVCGLKEEYQNNTGFMEWTKIWWNNTMIG